jgi:hypothetical protein
LPAGARIRSNDVARQRAQVAQRDRRLLVEVRVERYASLLHQHAAEMFGRLKCVSCEVAFHNSFPLVVVFENVALASLRCVNNPDIHSSGREFL